MPDAWGLCHGHSSTPRPLLFLASTLLLTPKHATSQLSQSRFPHRHELLHLIAVPRLCKSGERKLEDSSRCHTGSPRVLSND